MARFVRYGLFSNVFLLYAYYVRRLAGGSLSIKSAAHRGPERTGWCNLVWATFRFLSTDLTKKNLRPTIRVNIYIDGKAERELEVLIVKKEFVQF